MSNGTNWVILNGLMRLSNLSWSYQNLGWPDFWLVSEVNSELIFACDPPPPQSNLRTPIQNAYGQVCSNAKSPQTIKALPKMPTFAFLAILWPLNTPTPCLYHRQGSELWFNRSYVKHWFDILHLIDNFSHFQIRCCYYRILKEISQFLTMCVFYRKRRDISMLGKVITLPKMLLDEIKINMLMYRNKAKDVTKRTNRSFGNGL